MEALHHSEDWVCKQRIKAISYPSQVSDRYCDNGLSDRSSISRPLFPLHNKYHAPSVEPPCMGVHPSSSDPRRYQSSQVADRGNSRMHLPTHLDDQERYKLAPLSYGSDRRTRTDSRGRLYRPAPVNSYHLSLSFRGEYINTDCSRKWVRQPSVNVLF